MQDPEAHGVSGGVLRVGGAPQPSTAGAVGADLAQAARGLVDMVLEFLGNWHKIERACGRRDNDAITVITQLASHGLRKKVSRVRCLFW